MAVPGYAAEASLYRTSRSYRGVRRGPAADTGQTVVAQQLIACRDWCVILGIACGVGVGVGVPATLGAASFGIFGCALGFASCLDLCPPDTAPVGGGGGTPPECGVGRRCCDRDESGRCTMCVPTNAKCP
jgi:hypothetical protein